MAQQRRTPYSVRRQAPGGAYQVTTPRLPVEGDPAEIGQRLDPTQRELLEKVLAVRDQQLQEEEMATARTGQPQVATMPMPVAQRLEPSQRELLEAVLRVRDQQERAERPATTPVRTAGRPLARQPVAPATQAAAATSPTPKPPTPVSQPSVTGLPSLTDRRITAPIQDTSVPHPGYISDIYNRQAEALERQAEPPVEPGGWRGIGEAALRGLAGSTHPGGYHGYRADLDARERQRQQDLLTQAQRLRAEGLQRDQMNIEGQRYQQSFDLNRREFESADAERKARVDALNRPQFKEFGTAQGGIQYGQVDPRTARFERQGEIPGASGERNQGHRDVVRGSRTIRQYFDQSDPSRVTSESDLGPVKPTAAPGAKIPLFDAQGNVSAQWDTETGSITPVANPTGARRSGVPESTLVKETEFENAFRKISELGTTYKPEFTGPYEGRYEASKAGGVLSFLPFLKTPEGYGQFAALNADLKNSMIKLITGAQMGQQEAQRILQQVPVETDKDEIWTAKYDKTKANAEFLLQEIRRLHTSPASPTTTTSPTNNTGQDVQPRRTRIKLQ